MVTLLPCNMNSSSKILQVVHIRVMSRPYPFPFWVITEEKGNDVRRLLLCIVGYP